MSEEDEDFGTGEAYVSPVLNRVRSSRLTADDLRADVPIFQEGRAAEALLASPEGQELSRKERNALIRKVDAGKVAQERLVMAAIPLIKHIAAKEQRRRTGWSSTVTFDELFQEGMIGFLRGLMAYDPSVDPKAPTHYLGQWAVTEMRRSLEHLENDFGVPYETAERFRRIRAIRSRLASDLGREPTDDEIIDASTDVAPRGSIVLGRMGSMKKGGKALTQAQIDEEREFRTRVGALPRQSHESDDADDNPHFEESSVLVTGEDQGDASSTAMSEGQRRMLAALFEATLKLMNAGEVQREVIADRFGLYPRQVEATPKQIAARWHLDKSQVEEILDAFASEMAISGGFFHQATSHLDPEALADMGLGWVTMTLGDYSALSTRKRRKTADPALTEPLETQRGDKPKPPPPDQIPTQPGVYAQFRCDYHSRAFIGVYRSRKSVPPTRDCPSCGRASELLYVLEQK